MKRKRAKPPTKAGGEVRVFDAYGFMLGEETPENAWNLIWIGAAEPMRRSDPPAVQLRTSLQTCPQRRLAAIERAVVVRWHLDRMPWIRRNVILLRYVRSLTFAQIGKAVGITGERARRVHDGTIEMMRDRMAKTRLKSVADV